MGAGLQLLGIPRAETASFVGDLSSDKPASLLFYLARRGSWVSRSELAFLYRPDAPEQRALGNVRVYLHRARGRPWAEPLEIEKNRVRFRVDTDVDAFLDALDRRAWTRALDLYRGPFLEGVHLSDTPGFETWLDLERQELGRSWRAAALGHAGELERERDFGGAADWLERVLQADPLDEEALQAYLRVLFAAGRRAQALAAYEAFRDTLERELDIEPLEATRSLLETLNQGEPEPPGRGVPTPRSRHNLPAQTTRFVGRLRELAQLDDLLARPDCRLLTLVGLGGVGKTRLALELASGRLDAYPDGVRFAPLAGVGSPAALVSSIAGAVGFSFSGPDEPNVQLGNFLKEKELLLVLDNFEHLVEGSVLLEELLAVAPGLELLVTSRVALELSGEWLFDVEGLAYPPANPDEPLDGFDAVRLFVNRAERLSATFVAQGATLEAVAALTRRVEGLPLALELAASWTRSLSVERLLDELDTNLDLLSGQLRDLPERHRSVRTVFDYSWQRLDDRERTALAKLSVFQGGFTLDAAERVAGVHLALLLSLINHSLVRRSDEGRYQLHELVRQFARERLDATARDPLETGFGRYYLGRAAQTEPELRGPRQKKIVDGLLEDLDNLRAAWELALRDRSWETVDAALQGVHQVWLRANLLQEGRTLFARLVDELSPDGPPTEHLLARARVRLGFFQRNLGRFQDARASFADASETLRRLGSDAELAFALHELGHAVRKLGDLASAERCLHESLEACDRAGDDAVHADALFHLSMLRRDQGRFAEAKACLERCIELGTRGADVMHLASAQGQLGVLILQSGGDSSEARRYLEQSLASFRELDDKDNSSITLYNLGRLAYEEGDFDRSEAILLECLRLRRHLGSPYVQESVLGTLGEMARDRQRYDDARAFFEQSLELSRQLDSPVGQAYSLADLADVASRLGDRSTARRSFRDALRLLRSADIPEAASLEILYFSAVFNATDAPRETYPLVRFLARQEGLSRHLRQRIEQLAAELSEATPDAGGPSAADTTLETVVERQLALLEAAPG